MKKCPTPGHISNSVTKLDCSSILIMKSNVKKNRVKSKEESKEKIKEFMI